jgi:hypothetical protein
MSLVGPSGSGKSQLIFEMLLNGTFQPQFDKIFYFYQEYQLLYSDMMSKIKGIEFIKGIDFELINNLPGNGKTYLLIFDDSCAEISKSRDFERLATSGRHRKLNVIYIKDNLFHKSSLGRDIELQNTHIVLFKSPRDVHQVGKLSHQLGLGRQLIEWYKDATSKPFGHLLVDLSPRTVDKLRFCTATTSYPSQFYLPSSQARISNIDDTYTTRIYTEALPIVFTKMSDNFPRNVSTKFHSLFMRMRNKHSNRKITNSKKKTQAT